MVNIMNPVKLFISHSERDEQLVRPLAVWLQKGLGLSDEQTRCTVITNMDVGTIPAEELRDDIASAKVVVALLTANSLRSHWVQIEMGAGWVQKRLHAIRGPGINAPDLPSPLSDFITVGYCEKQRMQYLIHQLADLLGTSVHVEAEQEYDEIAQLAQEMLVADMVSWFSLPPVLSAWRVDMECYEYALLSLCRDLGLDRKDMLSCVTPGGEVIRDPDFLPFWARDLWTVSKNAVNFMLNDADQSSDEQLDVPPGLFTEQLIVDMKRALVAKKDRGQLVRAWFAKAQTWISENPPSPESAHGSSGHHRRR